MCANVMREAETMNKQNKWIGRRRECKAKTKGTPKRKQGPKAQRWSPPTSGPTEARF